MKRANASGVLLAGVVDWLAPNQGETILDLGCGDGSFLARMAKQFPERNFPYRGLLL
jgi:tRNA G46 methylase TrmB